MATRGPGEPIIGRQKAKSARLKRSIPEIDQALTSMYPGQHGERVPGLGRRGGRLNLAFGADAVVAR